MKKKYKYLPLVLFSMLAVSCSHGGGGNSDSDDIKVEVSEYNTSAGKQVYRMVTKTKNNSSDKTEIWYYDENDALVYYNEITDDRAGDATGTSTSISYSDSSKTTVFGKEVHKTFTDDDSSYVELYEDYDGNENPTTFRVKIYKNDNHVIKCEYNPNKTDKNVIKYSDTVHKDNGDDVSVTDYYAKNLTWDSSARSVSGELFLEKKVTYQYDESNTNVSTNQPLCMGYITETRDYDDTYSESTELKLLNTTYTQTEYRWNQDLYKENPMEEISYNLKYDSETGKYTPVKQSGYKIIQVADFEGQKKAIAETWRTSDCEIQYKYVYDYDVDTVYELDPEYYDTLEEKPLYMTKKSFYQNSSKGLFLAESSEILRYNSGENNEYCYEVEIHKTYDNVK